jgi:hypothetical protein
MKTTLDRFIDPENYHPDAVADAGKGSVSELLPGLLIIRLGIALRCADRGEAEEAIRRLEGDNRQAYELFQLMTGKLILALWAQDKAVIHAALEAWLDACRPATGSWRHNLLEAPELVPYLAQIDPAKLFLPETKRRPVTKADRALVNDINAARSQAVTENLSWLRDLGVTGTVEAIAKAYHIAHANHDLREVTLGSNKDDWPDLIVALDGNGAVIGSFIAH